MKKFAFSLLVLGFLAGGAWAESKLMVMDSWIRAMPPSTRVIPIYMTLRNHGAVLDELVAIESMLGKVELHNTVEKDGTFHMIPVQSIVIGSGKTVQLAPLGLHGMITQLHQPVPKLGDQVPVTLVFASGERMAVNVEVVQDGMASSDHHH